MTDERDLAATKAQLRHKNPKTTTKYDNVPLGDRRDALDNMGYASLKGEGTKPILFVF
jgi:hypothetical protein